MKKLTQLSLILFITAFTFSSCEEDSILRDKALTNEATEILTQVGSTNGDSKMGLEPSTNDRSAPTKGNR